MRLLFRNFFAACILIQLICLPAAAQISTVMPLIPAPLQWKPLPGMFQLGRGIRIQTDHDSLQPMADLLHDYLAQLLKEDDDKLPLTDHNSIRLRISDSIGHTAEAYTLTIGNQQITIEARGLQGLGWGIQSLRQLWQPGTNCYWLPAMQMQDEPRFAYRGMALDVSRHFFPVSFIRRYIDVLALYKFNTFHWHLTDDQGWRVEIKSLPRLQQVAAWRKATLIGHKKELPHQFDDTRYGGYYTQEEIREIVSYAQQRGITVIPEIEMPGHAMAALAAYPQLGCTGGPYETATFWGIFDDVFCAGNDSVFVFLEQVLDEVLALFPSPYIHIGGDECVKDKWKTCPRCQLRMRQQGLKNEEELQSYFIKRMEGFLRSRGRHLIGWDEILEGGLAPDALVMSWRGEAGGKAAAAQGHPVVMTPESHLYFDYYQRLDEGEPLAAGGYNPLHRVYAYDPLASMDSMTRPWVKGVEGQAWSEYYSSEQQAWYMLFPRVFALAEIGWTATSRKDYTAFLQRVPAHLRQLAATGVNGNMQFEEIDIATQPASGGREVVLKSHWPGARIHYTLDGSTPTGSSPLYEKPILLTGSRVLQAGLWPPAADTAISYITKEVIIHKASNARVVLTHEPVARFNTEADALVNGLKGNTRYNNRQWLGFSGKDLDVLIILRRPMEVSSISLDFLRYHWQRMWEPAAVTVSLSSNGKKFKQVYEQTQFPVNGVNTMKAVFPRQKVHSIRIRAVNKGIIPPGEYGQGNAALLLADEVIVQ